MPGIDRTRVSVVVPAYNSALTIEDCLKAVKSSSYRNFELVLVNDGSTDGTRAIASGYADKIIDTAVRSGESCARARGVHESEGELIICVDSDVVIAPDTLDMIVKYFDGHEDISALTGKLSKTHANPDFFSQYKNLYMHYIFSRLPERITFLYGSILAIRRDVSALFIADPEFKGGADTLAGQNLISHDKKIAFLNTLEVIHLKKYNFISLTVNNFMIPFYWAKIFIHYNGIEQMSKKGGGFAHSPLEQLISVTAAPVVLFAPELFPGIPHIQAALFMVWILLDSRFLLFLLKEKGGLFGLLSIPLTFFENIIMACGIICGFLHEFVRWVRHLLR